MSNRCPVCGFAELDEPAYDNAGCASFGICPSCGTEFGYHDAKKSHAELRSTWLAAGAPWSSHAMPQPSNWNGMEQLRKAGLEK
jgi:hypothetical protein